MQLGIAVHQEGTAIAAGVTVPDGGVRQRQAAAVQIERPVAAGRVDDGRAEAGTQDGQVAVDIEVAGGARRLAAAGNRDLIGAGGQIDGVCAGIQVRLDDGVAQCARQQGVSRAGDGVDRHHPLPLRLRLHADGACGLHRATTVKFKCPVGAVGARPGQVGTGRHVGTGQGREIPDQLLPRTRLRQVAAVKQQIGVCSQCVTPGGQRAGALEQGLGVESAAANLQHAVAAMRQHVDGTDVSTPCQCFTDQSQAVHPGVDGHDLQRAPGALLRLQVSQQRVGRRQ